MSGKGRLGSYIDPANIYNESETNSDPIIDLLFKIPWKSDFAYDKIHLIQLQNGNYITLNQKFDNTETYNIKFIDKPAKPVKSFKDFYHINKFPIPENDIKDNLGNYYLASIKSEYNFYVEEYEKILLSEIDLQQITNIKDKTQFPMDIAIKFDTTNETITTILKDALLFDNLFEFIKNESNFEDQTFFAYEQTSLGSSTNLKNIKKTNFFKFIEDNRDKSIGKVHIYDIIGIYIESKKRSYEDIIYKKPCHNEVLCYKIEKSDENGVIINNYYIPNIPLGTRNNHFIEFVDTQVKYNKNYSYRVLAYNLIIGNEYVYEEVNPNFKVVNFAKPILLETEILNFVNNKVLDNPPIAPDIDIIPIIGTNKIRFNLNTGLGDIKTQPIQLLEADQKIIDNFRDFDKFIYDETKDNKELDEKTAIHFKTDDLLTAFEIFKIDFKPTSYEDFKDKLFNVVNTDIDDSQTSPLKANSASLIDELILNKVYYYIFRAIDVHGYFSNPSDVFEVEIINSDGVIFPTIRVMNKNELHKENKFDIPSKSFRKALEIMPAFRQINTNENSSVIGTASPSVWDSNFKFSLTSKKTNKKIDIYLKFVQTNK